MVDQNATHTKRVRTMKQHLASVRAGQLWAQDVAANHLQHLSDVYDAVGAPGVPQPPIEEPQAT